MKPSVRYAASIIAVVTGLTIFWDPSPAQSQELEPRAYRALPVGLHFGLLVYSFSTGNVVVDPTTPVEGLELDVHTLTAGYLCPSSKPHLPCCGWLLSPGVAVCRVRKPTWLQETSPPRRVRVRVAERN